MIKLKVLLPGSIYSKLQILFENRFSSLIVQLFNNAKVNELIHGFLSNVRTLVLFCRYCLYDSDYLVIQYLLNIKENY